MAYVSISGQAAVARILEQMDKQRVELFSVLEVITGEQLWFRPSPGAWSIGENVDHLRTIYASMLPLFQAAWAVLHPLARLRRRMPYRVEIDNVYRRPGFPQKVGWMWPPRYTPTRPVSLDILREGMDAIQARVSAFYRSKDPDLLGHVVLWDPAIGTLNLIQALLVGVYHDEVHIDSIQTMLRSFLKPSAAASH
jgi:hypothetical protein